MTAENDMVGWRPSVSASVAGSTSRLGRKAQGRYALVLSKRLGLTACVYQSGHRGSGTCTLQSVRLPILWAAQSRSVATTGQGGRTNLVSHIDQGRQDSRGSGMGANHVSAMPVVVAACDEHLGIPA
jgi:hypothetical protein